MSENYLASFKKVDDDALHFGVKGMKWGIRRSSQELASGKAGGGGGEGGDKKLASVSKPLYGAASGESSTERYARISAIARAGQSDSLSDQDLNFYTKRTSALKQVNDANAKDQHWMAKAAVQARNNIAQAAMQEVGGAAVRKFISGPMIDKINSSGAKPDVGGDTKPKTIGESVKSNPALGALGKVGKAFSPKPNPSYDAWVKAGRPQAKWPQAAAAPTIAAPISSVKPSTNYVAPPTVIGAPPTVIGAPKTVIPNMPTVIRPKKRR